MNHTCNSEVFVYVKTQKTGGKKIIQKHIICINFAPNCEHVKLISL